MNYHPLANLFPLMEGREFEDLVADIKVNGLRERIVTILEDAPQPGEHKCYAYDETKCDLELGDGVWTCRYCQHNPAPLEFQILDGRNRWRACEELRAREELTFEPETEEYEGDDPLGFVISLNLHRRHLNETQRGMVAAKIENMPHGRPTKDANLHVSRAESAQLLNVSERTVASASKVIDRGALELVDAVERGQVSVSAAADVAELPQAEQTEIVARGEGEILEAAKRIRAARSEVRREERVGRIASLSTPDLPDGKYPVIYADPPWRYEFAESESRAIENQYPTMELDAICALPVVDRATDDAILFMWATSPKLAESMRVIEAWGFTYRSSAVWVKPQLGMGYYFRQQHELLLVATRGSMPAPAPADRPRSVYVSPREEHSAKPAAFYEFIEAMYPTLPKVELFLRGAAREGWAGWGNQAAA